MAIVNETGLPHTLSQLRVAAWCIGQGSSFAIERLWVRILINTHAAGGGELSTHGSKHALSQPIRGSAKQMV